MASPLVRQQVVRGNSFAILAHVMEKDRGGGGGRAGGGGDERRRNEGKMRRKEREEREEEAGVGKSRNILERPGDPDSFQASPRRGGQRSYHLSAKKNSKSIPIYKKIVPAI